MQSKSGPSDFKLFDSFAEIVYRRKFSNNDKTKSTMSKWQKTQSKDFYAERIQRLFFDEKDVLKNGD